MCFAAEIGLSGELRNIPKIDQRINEAEKLGFKYIVLAKSTKTLNIPKSIKALKFSKVEELMKNLFKELD